MEFVDSYVINKHEFDNIDPAILQQRGGKF